ncbi:hypothetical protein BX616_000105 [Lobosporangium transversale]|uniref:Calcineurin-like phosphoesterase domain-containing protein n=1 Tax=Lobosporangium transversale TaxID=64571 RepID=A0A1Y2GKL4_9FUNG|nr:hypothetical protein BCR41DRAFT_407431 [Lobosporangium transversale]KAF9908536.1 hypothetical protein BX616_000105 [Lobosporangium transversale]ORZ13803.1 hypothetical protein BCR41DRAFT_407431 [Lobosporangium transversale]|eukprot:XP_021880587.1 hypothetical protein BCR41DRAFT_407431 [Lobosporangium transversale]
MIPRPILLILWAVTGAAVVVTLMFQYYARISCHWRWASYSIQDTLTTTAGPAASTAPTRDGNAQHENSSFLRMVVFADPQMEGDAKIKRLGKRAIVDLAFNDAYMHHVYKSMMAPSWTSPLDILPINFFSNSRNRHKKGTRPTHAVVLGDLFSSQWIDDAEFNVRLGLLINITGNHDIGYGNDISQSRLIRWEKAFGMSNFISTVVIPSSSFFSSSATEQLNQQEQRKLHLLVVNTMLLDGPSSDEDLRTQTWQFMQDAAKIKTMNPNDKIVLLTHIPFHKEQGICVDAPDIQVHLDNTIIEQTMLTPNTTNWILNNIKPDFVLNGHDHFGCDVTHVRQKMQLEQEQREQQHGDFEWKAFTTSSLPKSKSEQVRVREITQRSLMAEYGGYSGLFEAKILSSTMDGSENHQDIEFHYTPCPFYTDIHVWVVIVTDLILVAIWSAVALYTALISPSSPTITTKTSNNTPMDKKSNMKC